MHACSFGLIDSLSSGPFGDVQCGPALICSGSISASRREMKLVDRLRMISGQIRNLSVR